MIISKFKSYQSVNEALLVIKQNLSNILDLIDSPIAKAILDMKNNDNDITINLLELGEKSDVLGFINSNKIKWELSYGSILKCREIGNTELGEFILKKLGVEKEELRVGDIGTIIKTLTRQESLKNGYRLETFSKLRTKDGREGVVSPNTLRMIVDAKPTMGRMGRVIRKLLVDSNVEFKDSDIEEFINEYRSKLEKMNNIEEMFELTSGDDIQKWYLQDNNLSKKGTLNSSCMRYDKCQPFLEIYSENKQVRLLVLKSLKDDTKITARALVWNLDDGTTFMDRVYYTMDHEKEIFIDYAIKNKWYFKVTQDSSSTQRIVNERGGTPKPPDTMIVTLDSAKKEYYPYTDTLKYINTKSNKLSSTLNINPDGLLEETSGGMGNPSGCDNCDDGSVTCYECDGSGYHDCEECGGSGDQKCGGCKGVGKEKCDECEGTAEIVNSEPCEKCSDKPKGSNHEECPDCGDTGFTDVTSECQECEGGKISCDDCDGSGRDECDECGGNGRQNCNQCDGNGLVDCPECY